MKNPRHILITGASSGIGAALSLLYAAPGVRLSLHGRNLARLEKVAEAATKKGATVAPKAGDVGYAEAMNAWIQDCDRTQPIDLVIANAGISAGDMNGQPETTSQARAIFAINVAGVLNTVQPAIPFMTARKRGQIAIMSSLAGFQGMPSAPSYCASKGTVRIYGEALRTELGPQNVEVNVICPGFVKTPMTDVNKFRMPFIISAEKAALIIKNGLSVNRARIAFPLPIYLAIKALAALPQDWSAALMRLLPRK